MSGTQYFEKVVLKNGTWVLDVASNPNGSVTAPRGSFANAADGSGPWYNTNSATAWDDLSAGGGGGFTPPDEFWVDQTLPTPSGCYPTIAAALAVLTHTGSIVHLHGEQIHAIENVDVSGLAQPASGTFTVNVSPVSAGTALTISTVGSLTAVAGPRTPGLQDFDGSLGTPALIAADIAAAFNDPANGFDVTVSAVAVGAVVTITNLATGPAGNYHLVVTEVVPGEVSASGMSGGSDGTVCFTSYDGRATVFESATTTFGGGDITFDDVNLDADVQPPLNAGSLTFKRCTGKLWQTMNFDGGIVNVDDSTLDASLYFLANGTFNFTRDKISVPDGQFAYAESVGGEGFGPTVNLLACDVLPTAAGTATPLFFIDQTDAEQANMYVNYTDCYIGGSGADDLWLAAEDKTVNAVYVDTRINFAPNAGETNRSLHFGGQSANQTGSIIERAGSSINDATWNLPVSSGNDRPPGGIRGRVPHGFEPFFDQNLNDNQGAWYLDGQILPMRVATAAAGATPLVSRLDGVTDLIPFPSTLAFWRVTGSVTAYKGTGAPGNGAVFGIDVAISMGVGGVVTVLADNSTVIYDTSAGQYTVTFASVAGQGLQVNVNQGTFGDASWDAQFTVEGGSIG